MSSLLKPPSSLEHLTYFVVRFYRAEKRYELMEPGRATSYVLGSYTEAMKYFRDIGREYLGQRAIDAATSFGASQALLTENRAWGLDLCRIDLDRAVVLDRDRDENRRIDIDDDDSDGIIVIRGRGHGKAERG